MSVALRTTVAYPARIAAMLYPLYREASRSPWICWSALRRRDDQPLDDAVRASVAARPVLVLGGFLSHPFYYTPLGRALTRRGYAVHFDDAFNARAFRSHVQTMRARVREIADAAGSAIAVVGHSLGGLHACALLAEEPDYVAQVVSIAGPIGGTPWHPLQRLAERILEVEAGDGAVLARAVAPYADRITTISSPLDLIAPPDTCAIAGARNVVLSTVPRTDRDLASHVGVVYMRTALEVTYAALAAGAPDPELRLAV
jgi:pimeloyl-ACP methyl ester carboxylesterase